ncbi:Dolichyl-P-Man:Man(5)GlcNAc(2)-PP-dolichyl mannosyltransferase [Phytophthora palmivora]|uniref:dolichyl-P-Man:Man5GlcNAc2-PP-dolichol alpha-1,3-mannosyltransferase n=1 Tax=Phytophthora palmivora TaxID=4796 RepID=A0A2P4XNU7_9STRA|nr:Dolichyl-P-Man:Man(5)GlcNAc(2)-PP-dolichyl mannosyltransferase [Phytophthora palmivora]
MARKKTSTSSTKRATRIDKDVKTTLMHSRLLSFLYDLMWSYRYFPQLACLLLLVEACVGYVIIQKVPYTEIDWSTYMQQVELFKAGERDYMEIRGDTGPLVYPAGFLYIFSFLHSVTDDGQNIRRAQYIFLGFYLIMIATVLAIYYRARVLPPWATVFLCVSKRLHSIFLLRMFNDGVAMMLLFIAVYLFARQRWRWGCVFFSVAVSVKMNVLLFAPALFFLLLQSCGILRTAWYLFICAAIQIALAYPFLKHNWWNYLNKAFELSRVFTFKWTVNWRFLDEETFVSGGFAIILLLGHLFFMVLLLDKHFNIIGTIRAVMIKPFAIYEPFPIQSEIVVTSLFVMNFTGIVFSRTLHYQFYSWYYPTLPYLLWCSDLPLLLKMAALLNNEYAFNTFPSTTMSSLMLQLTNVFLLISLYLNQKNNSFVPYLDAEARTNLIAFVNEECFDGARQLALYYGSVTEELAEGATMSSIDEHEVVLSLPNMKLTLAVGFGSSGPVTGEGYGRQVLKDMLKEAGEGIKAGDTMGKLINREYMKDKELKNLVDSLDDQQTSTASLRQLALAFESDDGSRAIEMQVQVQESDGLRAEDCDLRQYYDVARTVEQIRRGGYKKIALQFPDSLLPDASQVQQELKDGLSGQWERVFVLGDTSYGSCCVDEVAAQHLVADCIVHYGRTCLSATTKIPVIYVFGNASIQVDDCVQQLSERVAAVDVTKTLVLLYEPRYHHASFDVFEGLKERFDERKVVFGTMKTFYDPTEKVQDVEISKADENAAVTVLHIGGQEIIVDAGNAEVTPETFALLYIGAESAHLTSILMRYSTVDCFSYNPDMMSTRKEGATVNRALMRRFFLVQQAKEAQIYGILMGTLGVNKYLDVVHGLQKLIKKSGRKSYLFVVGKVNVPKLANYAEIDAFVLVACQQNTLMDSKEYYKPIVTPYELQLALSPTEEWDGQYKTDFKEVIPALEQTAQSVERVNDEDDDVDKPFFSLVSGTYKTSSRATDVDRETTTHALTASGDPDASTALLVKNERTELTTYHSEAADYLATREYQGLDPRIGKTPAHAAVEGSTGIARGYTHETE